MSLNRKQQRFVDEYLIDLNATQAAIRAGYSEDTARAIGAENLTKPAISAALAEAMDQRASELAIDARWVLAEAVSVYQEARMEEDRSAALKSLDLIGKHVDVGAYRERIEHTGKNGGPIEIEQVTADADAFESAIAGLAARAGTGEVAGGTKH